MKKFITFLFILTFLYSNDCFSQCGWTETYPYPTDNDLFSITSIDSTKVFAVGLNGTLMRTTDGGNSWINVLECSFDTLISVQFINQSTGFVAGTERSTPSKGVIYKTINGGDNWVRLIVAENYVINCMQFLNENNGYAAGAGYNGSILKTTNGGINWVMLPSGSNLLIRSLSFVNSSTGYIARDIGVFKTTDGGNNWSAVISNSNGFVQYVSFTNDLTGYVSGYHVMYPYIIPFFDKTTNGGNNWVYPSVPNNCIIRSVCFVNSNTGYGCGNNFILKSTNGGNNWLYQYQNVGSSLNTIYFTDSFIGFTAGYYGSILKTSDEGTNWNSLTQHSAMEYIEKIQLVNSRVGYAISGAGALKTTNAGQNWLVMYAPPNPIFLHDLFAIDSNLVYICGVNGLFIKTTNGGLNWITLNINTSHSLDAIAFLNVYTGFCFGLGNTEKVIFKTTNGGLNWSSQDVSFYAWGPGSLFIVNSNVIYVNSLSQIAKTTNGGTDWFFTTPPGFGIHNLFFFDAYTGFSVGYLYRIYKTTNGGINWSLQTSSTEAYFHSISFVNRDFGFAVGDYGRIVKTTNGGENWLQVSTPTDKQLYAVYVADTNAIHIGGGYGAVIFKSTNGGWPIGLSQSSGNIPQSFSLSQNYPNPFNPVTKIKYDVPSNVKSEKSNVKIIVYDILGREIETLVNETQKPGSYEVTWDGSRYASGVYFYRLITDNYSETKKMVLIK